MCPGGVSMQATTIHDAAVRPAMIIEGQTFVQPQTKTLHILKDTIGEYRRCFCSFDRYRAPEERTIHLKGENMCGTCAQVYCNENGIDYEAIDPPEEGEEAAMPPTEVSA